MLEEPRERSSPNSAMLTAELKMLHRPFFSIGQQIVHHNAVLHGLEVFRQELVGDLLDIVLLLEGHFSLDDLLELLLRLCGRLLSDAALRHIYLCHVVILSKTKK